MNRIIRLSTLAGCVVAAVGMTSFVSTVHSVAYAQRTLVRGQTVVYYDGYGQGYYGGNVQGYGVPYALVPNYGYSAFGSSPYGYGNGRYYPGYNNSGYYGPTNGQAFNHSPYYRCATSAPTRSR